MTTAFAALLARWAELAPDECRPAPRGFGEGAYIVGPFFVAPRRDGYGPHDLALVLWHVLACARERGFQPCVFQIDEAEVDGRRFGERWTAHMAHPGDDEGRLLADEDDADCPATAGLAAYVAGLETPAAAGEVRP